MQLRRFDGISDWSAPATTVRATHLRSGSMAATHRQAIALLVMLAVLALALTLAAQG